MRLASLIVFVGLLTALSLNCDTEDTSQPSATNSQSSLASLFPLDSTYYEPTVWGAVNIGDNNRLCLSIQQTNWMSSSGTDTAQEVIATGCGNATSTTLFIEDEVHGYRLSARVEEDGTLRYHFGTDSGLVRSYKQSSPSLGTSYVTAKDDAPTATPRVSTSRSSSSSSRIRPRLARTCAELTLETVPQPKLSPKSAASQQEKLLALPEARAAIDAQRSARTRGCDWAN